MPITRSASKRSQPTDPAGEQPHTHKKLKTNSPTPQTSLHVPLRAPAIPRSFPATHHALQCSKEAKPHPKSASQRTQLLASAKAQLSWQIQQQRRNRIRRLLMMELLTMAAQIVVAVASAPEEFGFDLEEEEEEEEEDDEEETRTRDETPGTPTPLPPYGRITSKNLASLVAEKGKASLQARLKPFLTELMKLSDSFEPKGWGGTMVNERRNIESVADTVEREFITESIADTVERTESV